MPFPNEKPQTYTILITEEQRILIKAAVGAAPLTEAVLLVDMLEALPDAEKDMPGCIHDFVFSPFG